MLKNKRGISLTTMVITVLIMLLIMGALVYSAVDSVKMRKLNKLYNDLRQLGDAVEIYYLKNGVLPIDTGRTGGSSIVVNGYVQNVRPADTRDEVKAKNLEFVLKDDASIISAANQNCFFNPNDFDTSTSSATYYFIKVGLLENVTLNNPDNEYIVNAQSHAVYNYTGVTINKVAYHSLPLTYKDVKYKENHAVYSVELKPINNVTNKNSKILYVAYNTPSVNLRDYLVFNSNTAGAGDGLGEPKNVTFKWTNATGHHNYYTLTDAGKLTKNDNVAFSDNLDDQITVEYENYDGTTQLSPGHSKYDLTIQYSYINIFNETIAEGNELESVNLAARHTESTYIDQPKISYTSGIIEKRGILGSVSTLNVSAKSSDSDIATGSFTSSSNGVSVSSGTKAGVADITYEVQTHGYAKDVIQAKVYDFKLYEATAGANTNLTKLDFPEIGAAYKKGIKLNVSLPVSDPNFSIASSPNSVSWTLVNKVVNNGVTSYVDTNSSTIVSLSNSDSSSTFNKDTIYITPLATGTAYLKCTYAIAGEQMGTIVIPLNVVGQLSTLTTGTSITRGETENTLALPSNKSAILQYTLTNDVLSGATVTYAATSSESAFTATQDATNKNKFTVAYSGSSVNSTHVTITATVTKNGVETKYSDTIKITYGT